MPEREDNGHFAKGNSLWRMRSSAGPKPKFTDPDDLWAKCAEYFEWVEGNPFNEASLVTFQGDYRVAELPKMRPMTIAGLCIFLDIGLSTWDHWRDTRPDLLDVITRVEAIIRDQKLTGAMAGFFNANIVSRDLGLKDTTTTEHSGVDGGAIQHEVNPVEALNTYLNAVSRRTSG